MAAKGGSAAKGGTGKGKQSGNAAPGADGVWRQPDGKPVSCVEKI